jgi:formate dehydrogenase subunit beta
MEEITSRIREEARKLLHEGSVKMVVGYRQGPTAETASPCFVTDESQVSQMIFNEQCTHNLAKYLVGREGYLTSRFVAPADRPRVALVAGPAGLRTIVGLIQENQFKREDLVVLGIVDGTPVGITPDIEVGRVAENREAKEKVLAQVRELGEMPVSERWEYWEKEFSKCIRCYACRQVCPLCYCEQCIAEENQPQWIDRSASIEGNRMWNIVRAFHLVGRCTSCGECDRVCPVDIPLSELNAKMSIEVADAFHYVPGVSTDSPLPLISFLVNDPESFIK